MANRREVNKLKEMLNHTENLVQDLQEELEMKDSLTVKELANDNYDSQDTCQSSFHERAQLYPMQNADDSTNYNDTSYDRADESSEHMSKIEAELEAELERLGLNMHASGTERRFSDLVEVTLCFLKCFFNLLFFYFQMSSVKCHKSLARLQACTAKEPNKPRG